MLQYLEDHLHKTFVTRTGFIHHSVQRLRKKNVVFTQNPKRKLSYRGSIRRTRTIQAENLEVAYNKGKLQKIMILNMLIELRFSELPSIASSRTVSPVQSMSPENEVASVVSADQRSPSPKEEEPWVMFTRHRTHSDAQYEHTDVLYLLLS